MSEPCEGAFHHPAARQDRETFGGIGAFDDLHGPCSQLGQRRFALFALIPAIGEDMAEPRAAISDGGKDIDRTVTVLHIGSV